MSALYAVTAAAYGIAYWLWPEWINAANNRLPSIRSMLSGRTWIIFGLISLLLLVIDGAFRVKRKALGKQARLHKNEIGKLATQLDEARKELEDSKPRLEGEIQFFYAYPEMGWVKSDDGQAEIMTPIGVVATVRVYFVNKTHAPTTIKHFRLSIEHLEGSQTYEARVPTEEPILRGSWDMNKTETEQEYVDNLVDFMKQKKEAVFGRQVDGYLQFRVRGLLMAHAPGTTTMKPVLTVTDAWGRDHELFHKKGVPLLPSQYAFGHPKPERL